MQRKDSPQQLWRTQFDKQFDRQIVVQVIKQTTALIRNVQRQTPWRDLRGPDDRLNDAILKLLDGRITWEPDRVSLEAFLLWAISRDIEHEIRDAKKRPHVSVDNDYLNQDKLEEEASERLELERTSKAEEPVGPCWAMFVSEMRKHAASDAGVLAIVDAYAQHAVTRADVMRMSGMSKAAYHAAYQRMIRYAKKIDPETLETIMQAIA
jgi:hypothetical protein